jgi:Zn-dependent protease
LSNFIFALFFAFCFVAFIKFLPEGFEFAEPLINLCRFGVYINLGLGVFNLIPLPPLDGSKMVALLMKPETERKFESLQQWSFWILLALMWTGALRVIYAPVEWLGSSMVALCARILGVG